MRVLGKGESVAVKGCDLIANDPDCGTAIVTSVNGMHRELFTESTAYGMVCSEGSLTTKHGEYTLKPGMYFVAVGRYEIRAKQAVVIERIGYRGLPVVGGPAEKTGRLRYIDGCTDTLLVGPPVLGDPCLNLLHFPKNIRQTMHTHPSLRCGITLSGRGRAIFPDGEVPLEPGSCWFLQTGGQHAFYTDDSELLVSAWHPDTDTGPSHHDHPMLNRTMVKGVSAKHIDAIRTK